MRRWIAVLWHASFLVIAGALYFFFVLPRWFELTGAWPSGLGLPMRITSGALIGLAALPVVFTLLRSRRPEFGTPQLALSLRFWSIVLHVLAGALIVGAAISEIWVSLDAAGQTLFGIYGAAAAIAILGALAFYLAFAAELPPPPPKPLKLKSQTRGRRRGANAEDDDEATPVDEATTSVDGAAADDATEDDEHVKDAEKDDPATVSGDEADEPDHVHATEEGTEDTEAAEVTETSGTEVTHVGDDADDEDAASEDGNANHAHADESVGTLRNRRPGGKSSRLFRRSRAE